VVYRAFAAEGFITKTNIPIIHNHPFIGI